MMYDQTSTSILFFSLFLQVAAGCFGQSDFLQEAKLQIGTDWVLENPTFMKPQPSYFGSSADEDVYIAALDWSGASQPFFWDCDLGAITFLTKHYPNFQEAAGLAFDKTIKGKRVSWSQRIPVTVIVNDTTYRATIHSWSLFEFTECPGTITFPSLSLYKLFDLPNALTNNLEGYALIGTDLTSIIRPSQVEGALVTMAGDAINGELTDIDADGIPDLFRYVEPVGDDLVHEYKRLYVNIGGDWVCVHIQFLEVCV